MALSLSQGEQKHRLIIAAAIFETILIGVWLGTMIGFAFIFAPAAFHSIGNLRLFAALIATVIRSIDQFGIATSILVLLLSMTERYSLWRTLRQGLILVMLCGTLIEHNVIVPHMENALAEISGNLQNFAPNTTVRASYDQVHRLSSSVYSVVVLAGLAALILRLLTLRNIREHTCAVDSGQR